MRQSLDKNQGYLIFMIPTTLHRRKHEVNTEENDFGSHFANGQRTRKTTNHRGKKKIKPVAPIIIMADKESRNSHGLQTIHV